MLFYRSGFGASLPAQAVVGQRWACPSCAIIPPWSRRSGMTSRAAHDVFRGATLATGWTPTPPPARAFARGEGWRRRRVCGSPGR